MEDCFGNLAMTFFVSVALRQAQSDNLFFLRDGTGFARPPEAKSLASGSCTEIMVKVVPQVGHWTLMVVMWYSDYVMNQNIQSIQEQLLPVLKRHNVVRSSLFGSFVRGEAGPESDIDILVDLPKEKSLFDFIGLKMDLEKTLNKKVDLLTFSSLSPRLKNIVEKEQVPVYGL